MTGVQTCALPICVVLPEQITLGLYGNVAVLKRLCVYLRVRVRSRSTYPMPTRTTRVCGDPWTWTCSCAGIVVVVCAGCWRVILGGGEGGWLTAVQICTVRFGKRGLLHSRPPRSRSGDFRADKVWAEIGSQHNTLRHHRREKSEMFVLDSCFFLLTATCFTRPLMKTPVDTVVRHLLIVTFKIHTQVMVHKDKDGHIRDGAWTSSVSLCSNATNFASGNSNSFAFTCGIVRARHVSMC